jgi:phosphotransacetylase
MYLLKANHIEGNTLHKIGNDFNISLHIGHIILSLKIKVVDLKQIPNVKQIYLMSTFTVDSQTYVILKSIQQFWR